MPGVVYLVDALPPRVFGGTPLVAWDYARSVAGRGWDVSVVTPVDTIEAWDLAAPDRRRDEPFTRYEVPPTAARGIAWALEAASSPGDPAALAWFSGVLAGRRPDVVHVISNVNLPLEWAELAHDRGIAVVRSVTGPEDLCGLGHPTSPRAGPGGYCPAPLTPARCARCVTSVFRPPPEPGPVDRGPSVASARAYPMVAAERTARWDAQLRRKRVRAAYDFGHVYDQILFSTSGFRTYFEQTLPLPGSRVRVVGMGLTPSPARPPARTRPADAPLRLTVLGQVHPTKGVAALIDAFSHPALVGRAGEYQVTFHGGGDLHLLDALRRANPSVEVRGAYRPETLPDLLAETDVGISASRFETSHRVTREYLQAGVPVIGSLAFGIPDVVVHGRNGLLFDHADPTGLCTALVALLDDPRLRHRLGQGARATRVRHLDEEIDDVIDVYHRLLLAAVR
jgi:glycosyltransferase involved in cell wall biosynthesis